jgi:hypothetical protein
MQCWAAIASALMVLSTACNSTPPVRVSKIHLEPDPLWAEALIRLGNAAERMAARLDAMYGQPFEPGEFVPACKKLVEDLIDFLDLFEPTAQPADLSSYLTSQAEADMLLAQWQRNRVLPPHLRLEDDR